MSAMPLDSGLFDTVAGLPVHPLVVHAAIVALPVAALGVLALLVVRRWRGVFGWLTLATLAVGTGAAFVAKESGEALAKRVGLPADHASWGQRLPVVAVALFVVAVVWFLLARRAARQDPPGGGGTVVTAAGILAGLLSLATVGVTVLVGHSGATAVWSGKIEATSAVTSTAAVTTTSAASTTTAGSTATSTAAGSAGATSGSASTSSPSGYTLAMVRTHNSSSSCWAAINGTVYDLTSWISQHPGGQPAIMALCGTDATAAFTAQHNGQRRPAAELAQFKLGPLS